MKKLLITGANGFIGRACINKLANTGIEIHGLTRSKNANLLPLVNWHECNFLDHEKTRAVIKDIRPSHMLHLAWCTKNGVYWQDRENISWVSASLSAIKAFGESGGEHLSVAGTCAEYKWGGENRLLETDSEILPGTFYGVSKNALHNIINSYAKNEGMTYTWGRIFSLYGNYEAEERLVPSLIITLLKRKIFICKNSNSIRDYLHVDDVADGFKFLLMQEESGVCNVASGKPIKIRDLVNKIASHLDSMNLIYFDDSGQELSGNSKYIVGDNSKLLRMGWQQSIEIEHSLPGMVEFYKGRMLL